MWRQLRRQDFKFKFKPVFCFFSQIEKSFLKVFQKFSKKKKKEIKKLFQKKPFLKNEVKEQIIE